MRDIERLHLILSLRQRLFQIVLKDTHLLLAAKIIDQQKAAAQQVFAQPLDFGVAHIHKADFTHISEGVFEQIRIVEAEDVFVFVLHDIEPGKLFEDFREVQPGFRVIVRPGGAMIANAVPGRERPGLDARKFELVGFVFLLAKAFVFILGRAVTSVRCSKHHRREHQQDEREDEVEFTHNNFRSLESGVWSQRSGSSRFPHGFRLQTLDSRLQTS